MKTTKHQKGHRWSDDEIKQLMALWDQEVDVEVIASELQSTRLAINKMIQRLRLEGIPLKRRTKGHVAGRSNKPWSQGEVEYLVRRRQDRATSEEIAFEMQRTHTAVQAMIQTLRSEGVEIPMRGNGVRRKWNVEQLKAAMTGQNVLRLETA